MIHRLLILVPFLFLFACTPKVKQYEEEFKINTDKVTKSKRSAYLSYLKKNLQAVQGDECSTIFLTSPSFDPESVIMMSKDSSSYFITYRVLKKNLWYSLGVDSTMTMECFTKEINQKRYKVVNEFFATVFQVFHKAKGLPGLDGTTYYVTTNKDFGGNTPKFAKVWSPSKGTEERLYISLIDSIVQFTKDEISYKELNRIIESNESNISGITSKQWMCFEDEA